MQRFQPSKNRNGGRRSIAVWKVLSIFLAGLFFLTWIQQKKWGMGLPPRQVWDYIHEIAPHYDLEPGFVFSIAVAESKLHPDARSKGGEARGIMQIKQSTWESITHKSYDEAWDWKTNVQVAMMYLDFCRNLLKKEGHFSYPLLAASYRYGPTAVKKAEYKINNLPKPKNRIYKKLFSGEIAPISLK